MLYRVFVMNGTEIDGSERWDFRGFFHSGCSLEQAYEYAADFAHIYAGEQCIVTPAVPRSWQPATPPREWTRNV